LKKYFNIGAFLGNKWNQSYYQSQFHFIIHKTILGWFFQLICNFTSWVFTSLILTYCQKISSGTTGVWFSCIYSVGKSSGRRQWKRTNRFVSTRRSRLVGLFCFISTSNCGRLYSILSGVQLVSSYCYSTEIKRVGWSFLSVIKLIARLVISKWLAGTCFLLLNVYVFWAVLKTGDSVEVGL